jgi:ribosome-binding factor A
VNPSDPDAVKAARLCRRVEEVLSLAISGCGDHALLNVSVRDVAPAEGRLNRLLVTFEAPGADPAETLAALGRAHGMLRNEVAEAIRRKRVPELLFRLAPPEA